LSCKEESNRRVVCDKAARGPDLGREEVRSGDHVGVRLDERAPRGRPVGRWLDAMVLQRLGDRAASHGVPDVLQRALDSAIAPGRVV